MLYYILGAVWYLSIGMWLGATTYYAFKSVIDENKSYEKYIYFIVIIWPYSLVVLMYNYYKK